MSYQFTELHCCTTLVLAKWPRKYVEIQLLYFKTSGVNFFTNCFTLIRIQNCCTGVPNSCWQQRAEKILEVLVLHTRTKCIAFFS